IRNDMHYVAVTLNFHHLGYANRAELRNAADIISREIDKHDVFRAFFWIGKELSGVGFIVRRSEAARASARNRPDLDGIPDEPDVHLRRAANKRKIVAKVQTNHVRRRGDDTKTSRNAFTRIFKLRSL